MPRLIDADALEKEYRRQFESVYKNVRDAVIPQDYYIVRKAAYDKEVVRRDMEAFCQFLQGRPTVDAEPVKRGRWMKSGMDVTGNAHVVPFTLARCSECNTEGSPMWKRCPVCEAKMGLEVQHAQTD